MTLRRPSGGRAGSDLRALEPSQDFPVGRVSFHLSLHLENRGSACFDSGAFFIDQLLGVFVEDEAPKPSLIRFERIE